MYCKECEARKKLARDALFNARVAEFAGHLVKGAAEVVGLKQKTAVSELSKEKESKKKD